MIPGEYTITITEGGIDDPKALKIHVTVLVQKKKLFNRFEVNFLVIVT